MAKKTIKLRAKLDNGGTQVKALITHPMETGRRKDKETGELIPAHFIQEIVCKRNGEDLLSAEMGGSVSKNPYLSFNFPSGASGDSIELSWVDNKGAGGSASTKIK